MRKEIVIAAYDRDYSWINDIDPSVKITVYRKGSPDESKPYEIFLENNVGRDVHTFFKHIVDKYDTLAEFTFFSQDDPFDHVSNLVDMVNGDHALWTQEAMAWLGECWFFDTNYRHLLVCDEFGGPHHPGLRLLETWQKIFDHPMPNPIHFVAAGHFCISRTQIHRKPKSFYERIVKVLEEDPESPWCIERFEVFIFT